MSTIARRLLITGGAGFIGGNFTRAWRAWHPGDHLVVLDALTYAGHRATIADVSDVTLVVGDIRDTGLVEALLRDHAIDTLVHFSAETHVDRSIAGPDAFMATNVLGTHSLLEAARLVWLGGAGRPHRFHHISTDEVFGSLRPDDPPFREISPYAPNSPYAASKAASDHLVRAWHHTYGLAVTTSHCSNNYGPYQHPEKLIPRFLIAALTGQPLPIYGDGLNRRDWLHVEDHCRGIEAVIARGVPGECYNLGGGQDLPNLTVIDALCRGVDEAFAADPSLARRYPAAPAAQGGTTATLKRFVPDRMGHDRRYAINADKARDALGFAPRRDFAKGLADTIAWYLHNEAWWQPLMR